MLPATATLPDVATLPATATLPAVAMLPATARLPAVAMLPATAMLPDVAALPTSSSQRGRLVRKMRSLPPTRHIRVVAVEVTDDTATRAMVRDVVGRRQPRPGVAA
jgi:hypothetical protein